MNSQVDLKKFLAAVLIGSIVTTAIVVTSIIIFGQLGRFELRVIMSAMVAIGVSILALICVPQIERLSWSGWSGLTLIGFAFILTLVAIWADVGSFKYWQITSSAWVLGIAFTYICGLLSREISGWVVTLRKAANIVILILAGVVILFIFNPFCIREAAYLNKVMGVLGVISAASALIILISSWLGKRPTPTTS